MGVRSGKGVVVASLVWIAACVGDNPATTDSGETDGGSSGSSTSSSSSSGSSSSSSSSSSGGDSDAQPVTLSIPALRNPSSAGHKLGTAVTVAGGIVTGMKTTGSTHGFFIQDPTASAWGGVYVFIGTAAPPVSPGDVVTVSGMYTTYKGFEQIQTGGNMPTKTGTLPVPAPMVVAYLDIAAGGSRAAELQSMLLRVQNVQAATDTMATDFAVRQTGVSTGTELFVTSYIANDIGASPFPATTGQTYSSITGFGYMSGTSDATAIPKLAPSAASDLAP